MNDTHTHDIKSSLLRLKQFNCDPFLVNYALKGIIAQKLVNPTQDYHSRRILDQEILSLAVEPTMPITSITDIKKLGPYIPYAISN